MTLLRMVAREEAPAAPAVVPGRPSAWRCVVVLALAGAAGAALLVASYLAAEWGRRGQFTFFWAGMLIFTLPAAAWSVRQKLGASVRLGVLIAYGLFTYLPKLLRNPTGPLYHDEFAHWRQSRDILLDGRLFESNPIVRVIGDFPGLHATVAGIAALTGTSVWQAGQLVLIVAHVLVVVGVAVLATDIFQDPRSGAAAAVIYGLNSSFLFFDTQFGYESLAIPLLIWTLVALLRAMRGGGRTGWALATLLLSAATVATHHLTALWLIGVMILLSTVTTFLARRSSAPLFIAWALTVATGALVAAWLMFVAPRTAGYLDPYLGQALDQARGMAGAHGSGSRTLFSKSVAPPWEQASAFAAPAIAGLVTAGAAVWWWRRRGSGPLVSRAAAFSMFLLGVMYFPAALLILTPSGAEGARRSWALSYLGLAVVTGPFVIALLDRCGPRAASASSRIPAQVSARRSRAGLLRGRGVGRAARVGFIGILAVMMVGNVAAGMNPSYRFPGPAVYGSDTRAASPEVMAAAGWLRETQGRGLRIVADRYSGLIFGSYGDENPVTGSVSFPTYDLYLARPGSPVSPPLLGQLSSWRFTYLVVDRRMALHVPDIKIYFEANEPIPHDDRPAFTLAQLTKFDSLPWTVKIYDSDDIAIYRFDFTSLGARAVETPR